MSRLTTVTTYAWDAAGNLASVTDAAGGVTGYSYDAAGRMLTTTDPLGRSTSTAYDAVGNVTGVTDALSNTTTFGYDALDRLTGVTDPDGHSTTYGYDGLGRTISVTDPLSHTTSYAYDAVGNLTGVTDPLGNTTAYAYDALDRNTSVTDALNQATSYGYDAVGNLTSVTDASGNTTTYGYDNLDRLLVEANALAAARVYAWDAADKLTQYTDRDGRITQYTYDALDRNTQETWKEGQTTVETLTFDYDAAGQLIAAGDSNSQYGYTYDDDGRVTQIDNGGTTGVPNVVLDVTYDAAGNRFMLDASIDGTADFHNDYIYDPLNRLSRISQSDASPGTGYTVSEKRVDISYNALSLFSGISRYELLDGSQKVNYTGFIYDDAGRLTDLDHTKGPVNLVHYGLSYDNAGRLTQLVSPDGTNNYTYDATSQLTAATLTGESYSYDDTGNRTNTGYSTGTNNRLLSDGTYTYEYDGEGNRTKRTDIASGDTTEYAWDHHNRLTSVSFRTSGGTLTKQVQYTYDVFDRLIGKAVDDDGDGIFDRTERFVYDGDDVVLSFDGAGSLTHRYLHGDAVDQVFASEDALGEVLWALTDYQGTVRDIADYDIPTDTLTFVNQRTFDSFGNVTSESNPSVEFRYAWTGRFFDADTGLQYNRRRWYDPQVGRWISEDPIGFAAGDANLSRYVGNSPGNATDPSGLSSDDITTDDDGKVYWESGGWRFPIGTVDSAGRFTDTLGTKPNLAVGEKKDINIETLRRTVRKIVTVHAPAWSKQ